MPPRQASRIRLAAAVCLSAALLCALALVLPSAVTPSASAQADPTPTPFPSFVRQIELTANRLAYNGATQTIFATVPSKIGPGGNSVVQINGATGAVGAPVWVGSEPTQMAFSDDGQTMYVSLEGARAVRRFDVATQTPGLQFGVGPDDFTGANTPGSLAVMPGQPQTVAVRRFSGGSAFSETVVFDNGVPRPQTVSTFFSSGSVHFGGSPSRLYTGDARIQKLTLSASGLTADGPEFDPPRGGESQFDRTRGLLFTGFGDVINPEAGTVVGQFASSGGGSLAIDPPAGRFYVLRLRGAIGSGVYDIVAYDMGTLQPVGHTTISGIPAPPPAGAISDLVRWGTNGLAFRVPASPGGRDTVVLVRTQLIDPASSLPTPTPTPQTPTPTPTPYVPTFVRKVGPTANDVVYNEATQLLYASVPSAEGAGGNSVVPINPLDGTVGTPLAVGSEPSRLALADDGRTLYVYLDGPNAVRRVDLQTMTAGLQFAAGVKPSPDMEVMPGRPQTLAVSHGVNDNVNVALSPGVSIYDDGVERPKTGDEPSVSGYVAPIEFASPSALYGYNNPSGPFNLIKFDIAADGAVASRLPSPANGSRSDIKYAGGRLYFSHGQVTDPEARRLVATFDGAGSNVSGDASVMAIDPALGRAFFLVTSGFGGVNKVLKAYDLNTFVLLGSVPVSMAGRPTRMVRWGANGLAVRTATFSETVDQRDVYIIQSALVSPSASVPVVVRHDDLERTVSETAAEIDIAVLREGDLSQTTTVPYATADGTATAGSDYVAASGTLTFAPGESAKFVKVQLIPDIIHEGNETFVLTLGTPSGDATLQGPASAQVTILDEDPLPTVSIAGVRVGEGNSGTTDADFVVTLSNPTTESVKVNYATADGTAQAPGDYEAASGTLTLPPLATSGVIRVKVVGDTLTEPEERFFVFLSSPVDATLGEAEGRGQIIDDEGPSRIQFEDSGASAVSEGMGHHVIKVTRSGDNSTPATVTYSTLNGTATERSDYTTALGTLRFAPGEVEKSLTVLITDDTFEEGFEHFNVLLGQPSVGALGEPSMAHIQLLSNDVANGPTPVVPPGFDPHFFVTQHYHDFLNREPDPAGLAHWTNEFTQCNSNAACLEVKRVNVSAAFFLSIEFQETGYFVYRVHQAAFDTRERLRRLDFLADTQEIGRDVQVGVGDWRAQIDANKKAFVDRFAASAAFVALYGGLTNAQYVDALNAKTYDPRVPGSAGALSAAERDALVADLDASRKTRADVLRAVAENAEFSRRQVNHAFVLMEYFGYMRRNPDAAPDVNFDGYNFWLGKLNEFNGDYIAAEMVKAFITSGEYGGRFGL